MDYAGYIIPPPPPRPDFDASREKLRKLGDAEGTICGNFLVVALTPPPEKTVHPNSYF